ncbi:MAG: SAM-dependent methyltransferase [Congregibacter sp.]|jgi:SAM-dependent methyltransferase
MCYRTRDYNRRIDERQFNYVECQACKTLQLAFIPENLATYYASEYFQIPLSAANLLPGSKVDRFKLSLLKKHTSPCEILEIGPGVGGFAYLAKVAGYFPQVIEIDRACRQFIQEQLEIPAVAGPEDLSGFPANSFDCIALWHVLEHLTEPRALMNNLWRVLRPGGTVLLALPNPDSLQFSIFGRFWAHLDAPRHVALPPAQTLIRELEARDLQLTELTSSDAGTLYWNRFGWTESMKNLSRSSLTQSLLGAFGMGAAAISYSLGSLDPTRSAYTLVVRKASL